MFLGKKLNPKLLPPSSVCMSVNQDFDSGTNVQGHWNSCAELSVSYIDIRNSKRTVITETSVHIVINDKKYNISA